MREHPAKTARKQKVEFVFSVLKRMQRHKQERGTWCTGDLLVIKREFEDLQEENNRLRQQRSGLRATLDAASVALKSYQYGNSNPNLAKIASRACDSAITVLKEE